VETVFFFGEPERMSEDPRFHRVHSDPRFKRISKKKNRVRIDERFKEVLTDEAFRLARELFTVDSLWLKNFFAASFNKHGRKVGEGADASEYYQLEGEDGADMETKIEKMNKIARGEVEMSSSSDSEEEEGVENVDDIEMEDEEDEGAWGATNAEEEVPVGQPSRRIAAVNLDWQNIRAMDIFAVVQVSFSIG
jgi:hypothetical protein